MPRTQSGRCSECDGECNQVWGQGPLPCDYLLIGEKPGQWEDRTKKPFQGDAGKELDRTYIQRAGLDRADVRVTNTVLCRSGGNNNKPSEKLVKACSRFHLPDEIAQCQPKYIILMGATACSLLPDINLEIEHGRPVIVDSTWTAGTVLEGWEGVVVPMYHPASGLHDTRMIQAMVEDWEYFGKWMRPSPQNSHVIRTSYHLNPIIGYNLNFENAVDLESVNGKVWSIQLCSSPGRVVMYHASWLVDKAINGDSSRMEYLHAAMKHLLFLHNAPGDRLLLAQLGLYPEYVVDTMQRAYHRQNLPQGLKALGYRLFGIRMMEYQDLVMPYSKRALEEWMANALVVCESDLRWVELKQLKTKVKEIQQVSQQEKALRRILGHSLDKDMYDPWERLDDLGVSLNPVVDAIGKYPVPSIEHVPERLAVEYACQDADVTLRLGRWLRAQEEVGMGVEECDVDR